MESWNGSKINIWQDPWISSSVSRKVITPRGQSLLSKVEELINPHTSQWDEELIRSVFSSVGVSRILQIPLRVDIVEDFVAWNHTRSGYFSVRSSYHVEFDHQYGQQTLLTDGARSVKVNEIWKDTWRLKVPGKVKHFVWKVLRGVLPCYGVLGSRHIPVTGQCLMCKIGLVDIQHCLFTCTRSMEVWAALGLEEVIMKAVEEDRWGFVTMEILERIQANCGDLPMAELIVVAAWYIWWQRHQFVRGETIQSPDRTSFLSKYWPQTL